MTLPFISVLLAMLLVARDLVARRTERRLRAEIETLRSGLKDTDRLGNVSRLVSGLAQDLKSPLQGVLGNAEVLAAANSLRRQWHNLNDVVTTALDSRRAELAAAGVRVSLDGAAQLPLVFVDRRQLERVITTLLDRWTKGIPSGAAATVTVSTRLGPSDERLIVSIDDPSASLDQEDATWSGDLDACRRVLETHGGALEVERRPTGGFGC